MTQDKAGTSRERSTKKAGTRIKKIRYGWVMVSTLALTLAALAQQQRPQQQQQRQYQPPPQPASDFVGPTVLVSPDENYRIGPADVLSIEIADAPELSRAIRVNADGQIVIPVLGTIAAYKRTPDELAKLISDALRSQEYLRDPQVSVSVLQINSRTFFIQGAVHRPGVYQVEGKPSLLKLITLAGGLNENYGSTAYVIREVKEKGLEARGQGLAEQTTERSLALARTLKDEPTTIDPSPRSLDPSSGSNARRVSAETASDDDSDQARYEMLKVNINGLLRGNFDQNIAMRPGDIIHIPPTDVFFVAGEVNSPGSFPLKEGTTLRQAVSLAQGPTFSAAGNRGVIFREDTSTGKRQEIKVDIGAVMSGKKEDVAILANDIIIVPNSRLKSVGGTLLRAFGVNATRMPIRYGY